jgi:hypothetical protein
MAGGRRSDWRARPGGDVQLCEKFQPKPKAWTACPPEVPTKTVGGGASHQNAINGVPNWWGRCATLSFPYSVYHVIIILL